MPMEKLNGALDNVKSDGIQNILALCGDPPHGQDKFVTIEGGFLCALDLVRHIKAKYGDYFGITVAKYPGLPYPGKLPHGSSFGHLEVHAAL